MTRWHRVQAGVLTGRGAGVFKEAVRHLLRHHARDREGRLEQIPNAFIPGPDYGMGCRYSLFEQAAACVEWMRGAWAEAKAAPL